METKSNNFEYLVTLVILVLTFIIVGQGKKSRETIEKVDSLQVQVDSIQLQADQWEKLVILYRDHLEHCSFIENDDVYVGKYGQLYSRHARYPGKYFETQDHDRTHYSDRSRRDTTEANSNQAYLACKSSLHQAR